jgi:lysozyme
VINAAGLELIKHFEGFKDTAYKCPADVWTIGYGFTKGVKPGDTMTRAEADMRLAKEVNEFAEGVARLCTRKPTDNQLAAMTALAFNIGLGAFQRSSVLRHHNAGDFNQARAAFALWNKAGGKVLAGLVRRRAAEAQLYGA